MSRRALVVAVVAALLGALCLHVYLDRFEREVSGGDLRAVVVAVRDLPRGAQLAQGDLTIRRFPERYSDERHVAEPDLLRVLGGRLVVPVPGGSALCWTDLDSAEPEPALAHLVPTGQRGYALRGVAAGVQGLLRPGDRVDLLLSEAAPGARTRTLLQNLLVLHSTSASRALSSAPVTIAVTGEQAQVLAHAERAGTLTLVVRHPDDLVVSEVAPLMSPQTGRRGSP
jgi:pilus assembly protein CpaB